eukprot:2410942-Alexandrium_andersonii.AAC.1
MILMLDTPIPDTGGLTGYAPPTAGGTSSQELNLPRGRGTQPPPMAAIATGAAPRPLPRAAGAIGAPPEPPPMA